VASKASGGTIGGTTTYEFQVPASVGEDKIIYCSNCQFAVNKEVSEFHADQTCQECQKGSLEEVKTIEVGHIFNLGTDYSEKMEAYFTDQDGVKKPVWMGCYGIGLGRLMATVVETHHDEKGIIWPKEVAPFQVHLLNLNMEDAEVVGRSEEVYQQLIDEGFEVLYDDREMSAGVKLADADLIGIPMRLIVSQKSLEKGGIEVKNREEKKGKIVSLEELVNLLQTSDS